MTPDELQQRMDAVAELTVEGREYLFGCMIAVTDERAWARWLVEAQTMERRGGGYIPGPPVQVPIRYLREVEPGLQVVSIGNGRPEYLMSREWIQRNPGKVPVGEPAEARGWRPEVSRDR